MPTNTEAALRDEFVSIMQGIATTKLGFDEPKGNIKDYLLEHEANEKQVSYLSADVDGVKRIRAWAAWVVAKDNYFAMRKITERTYEIIIAGYYELGINGAGAKLMVDHACSIREAVSQGSTIALNTNVRSLSGNTPISISPYTGVDAKAGQILLGIMRYLATTTNPDWV